MMGQCYPHYMALNIRPFYGPNFPFNHPLITFPDKGIPLRSKSQNEQDILKHELLAEDEMMRKRVKKILEDAKTIRFRLLDTI